MSEFLGLTASAAGGGLFGIIGTALGRVAGYFEQRQSQKHEVEKWKHELRVRDLDMQAKREQTEADLSKIEAEGSWSGLTASLEAEASIGDSYLWVNAVRGLTRPVLTLLLWLITALIFFNVAPDQRENLINTATFAATAATLWWFGDRGPNRAPRFIGPTQRLADAGQKMGTPVKPFTDVEDKVRG